MNLFHSARLKLTGFYFAVLVIFCLLLTFGVRAFTDHELRRGDDAQRGAVHSLVQRYLNENVGDDQAPPSPPPGDRIFANAQNRQYSVTRAHLNRDFLLIDLGLLAVGAVVSYWYAGRTLRPIEEAHELQKRFTSDASHELRTPLTSMKLENELFLRQNSFGEADARELIASNLEEVERLERLATNLLSLNEYEHGALQLQPADVTALAGTAVETLHRSKSGKKAAVTVSVAPATIRVDQESFKELLAILFDNGLKYGPARGPLEVSGQKHGNSYRLQVRDHGAGITTDDLPHIFERMYRGDKARSSKISGHGIGLSLAQQIATANHLALAVDNHPDGGAVFTITCPL